MITITVPTIGTGAQGDGYRPDLPEGLSGRDPQYSADYQTVTVTLPDTPEVEQWAVEQGYHVPDHVDPGHLMVALLQFDEQLFDAIEAAIESDKQVRAAMRASFVSRHSLMLQGFCQQFGITEEQKNALFVAAYLLRL